VTRKEGKVKEKKMKEEKRKKARRTWTKIRLMAKTMNQKMEMKKGMKMKETNKKRSKMIMMVVTGMVSDENDNGGDGGEQG